MNDLISIIVPVFNVSQYLRVCLNSILNQTYANIEIIVIDDGSTDDSLIIAKEYEKNYKNIYVIHKENNGLGFARNTGLDVAKGKFVMFIDSDDYIKPNYIQELYSAHIDFNVNTVIAGYSRDINGEVISYKNKIHGVFLGEDIKKKILPKMFARKGNDYIEMSVWKTLFSMETIKQFLLRFPDRSYISEDIIFDIYYYSRIDSLCLIDNTDYCYRYNTDSLSQGYREDKFEKLVFQYEKMKQLIIEKELPEECVLRTDIYLLGNTMHYIKQIIKHEEVVPKNSFSAKTKIENIINNKVLMSIDWKQSKKNYNAYNRLLVDILHTRKSSIIYFLYKFILSFRSLIKG